jgi:CheY-like chemotaxis protein
MATLGIGFQLSASAVGMAQGINAGVVELQKLGYAAKQTARDVSTLKTLEISRAFISGISSIANTFQAFTSGALNAIDNTRQLAASLGVSYQELRTLQVAADLSGASSEELAKAFTRAQVTISKAAGGSKEATKALSALGLSVDDLATQTSTQQFQAIATAINGIENPAQRAAAAVAIFGKSGALLLPTFRELPENLKTAQTFLGGFRDGVNGINPDKIDAIGDSFGLAGQAMQELAGRILTQLQPALTQGTDNFIKFVQSIDVPAAARTLSTLLEDVGNALAFVGRVAVPLAQNLLPAIGGYLAFINRQVIAGGIASLAKVFVAAATASAQYSIAAGAAAVATNVLAVSVRAFLAVTGVGLLVVIGAAVGGLAEWASAGTAAGADIQAATAGGTDEMKRFRVETDRAGVAAFNLGEEVKKALKVPEQISIDEFAQGALNEARSAIVSLAKELGGLDKVPADVLDRFNGIRDYASEITEEVLNQGQALRFVDQNSQALIATVQRLTEAEKAKAEAAKASTESARKAAEESRKRVTELASQGLTAAESSRVQLNRDLLDIANEQRAAEEALQAARKAGDAAALSAANKRLRLAQAATAEAKAQDRQRQLDALGIDDKLLKPATTIADQFKAVRKAFDAKLIDGGEARQALRNLAAEGVQIRQEIAAELSRPARQALQVNDIRSQEGLSQFLALANGREDPAVEQRREQLNKLEQIRRELANVGARPVDILGGA